MLFGMGARFLNRQIAVVKKFVQGSEKDEPGHADGRFLVEATEGTANKDDQAGAEKKMNQVFGRGDLSYFEVQDIVPKRKIKERQERGDQEGRFHGAPILGKLSQASRGRSSALYSQKETVLPWVSIVWWQQLEIRSWS